MGTTGKIVIATALCAACTLAAVAGTYWHTREKWFELGKGTGFTHGRLELMEKICALGITGAKPGDAVLSVHEKYATMSLKPVGDGVHIICEGF